MSTPGGLQYTRGYNEYTRECDTSTSAWLIDFGLKITKSCRYIALRLEKSFKKFFGRYQDLNEKYQRSVKVMVNDLYLTCSRILVNFLIYIYIYGFVT